MENKKFNFSELNESDLKNILGGGEPVPGAEILIEQEGNDVSVEGSGGGTAGTANKTGGKYMGQVGHF